MKSRTAQSGARKNPDSPRVHGLRLAVNSATALARNAENSNDRVFHSHGPGEERIAEDERDVGFEPLLNVTEAAKLLRIHPKTLRVKARRGIVPAIQIGRVWRFRVSALNGWLEKSAS